jgi:hypothetical protein
MAAGHQILSDFPLTLQHTDADYSERKIRGRGMLNGGGELLRIRTVNGNIEIHKLDPQTLEQLRQRQSAEWGHQIRKQKSESRTERPDF